jgi:hypothetical protein
VIKALRQLRTEAVLWPAGTARHEIKDAFALQGFPGAIGAIDGTLIRLVEVPPKDGIYYYCHKKFYGVRYEYLNAVTDTTNIFFAVECAGNRRSCWTFHVL